MDRVDKHPMNTIGKSLMELDLDGLGRTRGLGMVL